MRLIDADKLLLQLNDDALCESPGDNESAGERRLSKIVYNTIQNCMKSVEQQPTVFDVDKVVEQLKMARDGYSTAQLMTATNDELVKRFIAKEKAMNLAIKIVKESVIDGKSE